MMCWTVQDEVAQAVYRKATRIREEMLPATTSTMVVHDQWFRSEEKAMLIGTKKAEYVPSNSEMTMPCHTETCRLVHI